MCQARMLVIHIMCSISSFPNEPGEEVADEIGGLPLHRVVDTPKPGDVIYVDTDLYVWHGVDDFHGGKAIGSSCAGGEER